MGNCKDIDGNGVCWARTSRRKTRDEESETIDDDDDDAVGLYIKHTLIFVILNLSSPM